MSEVPEVTQGVNQRSQLADAVAACVRSYTGRGPTATRVLRDSDAVVVIMRDALSKGEQNLVDAGHIDEVLAIRRTYQRAMRDDTVAAIESITGQPVITFMSANSADPDYAVEVFILGDAPTEPVISETGTPLGL